VENVFITMSDGVRLAARMWIPDEAFRHAPVPAILEYIPYRKRDLTRARDDANHPYMASHGYACVRVDLRGSGDSEGVLEDEYRPVEQDDALTVIQWLREQPWCNGTVGMMGISWGGFNALQVAARRPPGLRAIISVCASDDLYHDNMHYMGGCLLTDNLSEATVMFAYNSLPPDPEVVGARWREMWQERLRGSGLWIDTWLQHQRRDDYWKPASVAEDYAAIACPVFAVSGWADGYTNAVFRLLAHLQVPRRGLIGPWGHKYPHMGQPGPAIGFLQEAVRWWDHWLKGVDTGIMDEPVLRAWMQDWVPPDNTLDERPGHWVGEREWPPSGRPASRWAMARGTLQRLDGEVPEGSDSPLVHVQSPLSVGLFAGKWASYAAPPDLPFDQREEDGGAIVFESGPLDEECHLLGMPSANLRLMVDAPVAMVAVRLSDVAPSGEAARITYGLLNLTHRDGNAHPTALDPGHLYDVVVPLNGLGHVVPRGHRLRLSISTSYWPLAWPSPEPTMLSIATGNSWLELPVRPPDEGEPRPEFGPPQDAGAVSTEQVRPGKHRWDVHRDLVTHTSTLAILKDVGQFSVLDTGTHVTSRTDEWYSVVGRDPASARGETRTFRRLERGAWAVEIHTRTILTCTPTHFLVNAQLDAYECGEHEEDRRVHAGSWTRSIPRDHV
jgi:uncharacterized protein